MSLIKKYIILIKTFLNSKIQMTYNILTYKYYKYKPKPNFRLDTFVINHPHDYE